MKRAGSLYTAPPPSLSLSSGNVTSNVKENKIFPKKKKLQTLNFEVLLHVKRNG
jgi:hypothetical protein